MVTNTNTSQFIVTRNGSLDQEWLEAAVAQERQEALQAAGKALVAQTLAFTSRVALAAGRGVLEGLETYLESVQSANQAKS